MEKKKEIVKKESKEGNGFIKWIKENDRCLLFGLIGLIIGVLVMGILWPERIPKLKGGEEVVVSLSNTKITADDLYKDLKTASGLGTLINLIDTAILDDKYDLDEEALEYATTQADQYYQMYESYYGMTKDEFLAGNGFKNEQAFFDVLANEFLSQRYYDDYLKSIITDDEIDDFYNDEVFGERKVYVFSATDKKNDLEKVRSQLKKGTKVSKLKDKYDGITYTELESVTFDKLEYTPAFLAQVQKLGKGEYSKVFEDDNYGYTVVYVSSAKEKPELKDAENGILTVLSSRKDQGDSTLYYKAFIELREAYEIKFYDEDLEKLYNDTMDSYTKTEEPTTKESE